MTEPREKRDEDSICRHNWVSIPCSSRVFVARKEGGCAARNELSLLSQKLDSLDPMNQRTCARLVHLILPLFRTLRLASRFEERTERIQLPRGRHRWWPSGEQADGLAALRSCWISWDRLVLELVECDGSSLNQTFFSLVDFSGAAVDLHHHHRPLLRPVHSAEDGQSRANCFNFSQRIRSTHHVRIAGRRALSRQSARSHVHQAAHRSASGVHSSNFGW